MSKFKKGDTIQCNGLQGVFKVMDTHGFENKATIRSHVGIDYKVSIDRISLRPKPFDTQIGGDHYKNMKIQPSDFIMKNDLDFFQGNVIKYIARYKNKNGLEDLKKARHYIDMIIDNYDNSKDSPYTAFKEPKR